MKANELIRLLEEGGLSLYEALYSDLDAQKKRMIAAVRRFTEIYGDERDIALFSVPGRSEILGNHTDHNHGCVLAGAIDRDIIAVAAKNNDGKMRLYSEGYAESVVNLDLCHDPKNFKPFTSIALMAGVANGLRERGYKVGGFDTYSTTEVLKGSGLSSSAAFEVMMGNILNHFYNGGKVSAEELAKIAQYSENVYFGKPCGLMDQMACAVGGFVFIDFESPASPKTLPIPFSLTEAGYSLCIVNTGGSHANLNEDYASVPSEMKAVAATLGHEVLRPVTEKTLLENAAKIRASHGDRALLRALHFVRENERVLCVRKALLNGDVRTFLALVSASGNSSFKYLQNVYTNKCVGEQGLSLALALAERYLSLRGGACRVHGGGFAGTIQAFVKHEDVDGFASLLDGVFGEGATLRLSIRPLGAVCLFG